MQNKEISEALAAPDGGKTDLGFEEGNMEYRIGDLTKEEAESC